MKSKLTLYKENLIRDPYFKENGAPWTSNNWVIQGNRAAHNPGTADDLKQDILTPGVTYKITLSISNFSGNVVSVNTGSYGTSFTTSGTFTFTQLADSTTFNIHANVNFYGMVWAISCVPDPGVYDIELSEDVSTPITFSIADIRDPSSRDAVYSKTIVLPGTAANNRAFNSIFEISSDGLFNPNKKARVTVMNDGLEILNGVLQIKTINRTMHGFNDYAAVSYEVIILGHIRNIMAELGDTYLQDLDFSKFDHTYNLDEIVKTWGGFASTGMIRINGVDTSNWVDGPLKNVASVTGTPEGRLQLTFATAHGYSVGDQIFYLANPYYLGDHKIQAVPTNKIIVLHHPHNPSATGTGQVFKHEPKGVGYVYPMIQRYSNYNAKPATAPSIPANTQEWNVTDFQPAIYVKQYIDSIFEKAGFTYESNFFNSALFKRLIIPFGGKEFKLTESEKNSRMFSARMTTDYTQSYTFGPAYLPSGAYLHHVGIGTPQFGYAIDLVFDNDFDAPFFDNTGTFNASDGLWTCTETGRYDLTCDIIVDHTVSGIDTSHPDLGDAGSSAYCKTFWSCELVDHFNQGSFGGDLWTGVIGTGQAHGFALKNLQLQKGHKYGVRVHAPSFIERYVNGSHAPILTTGSITFKIKANATFSNYPSNQPIQEDQIITLSRAVPDKIKCKDFLKSIINMFNLYVSTDPNNDRKLKIEPRDDFYSGGTTIDWTDKLDINSPIEVIPMGELQAKNYIYSSTQDKDFYNDQYQTQFSRQDSYGDFKLVMDNDFISGDNTSESIFSPTMLDESVQISTPTSTPVHTKRVISQIFQATLVSPTAAVPTGVDAKPVENNIRILYFAQKSVYPVWVLKSIHGYTIRNQYPYAGHLDSVFEPSFDLNWAYPFGFTTISGYTFKSWTDHNLFNAYHKNMLDEIIDKDSKIVTCYLNLKPSDINKLDFRASYIIDNNRFRLNKVIDYDLTQEGLTKCEFLKANTAPRFVAKHHINTVDWSNASTSVMPFPKQVGGLVKGGGKYPVILGVENPTDPRDNLLVISANGNTISVAEGPDIANYIDGGEDVSSLRTIRYKSTPMYIDASVDEPLDPSSLTIMNYIDTFDVEQIYQGTGTGIFTIEGNVTTFKVT